MYKQKSLLKVQLTQRQTMRVERQTIDWRKIIVNVYLINYSFLEPMKRTTTKYQ